MHKLWLGSSPGPRVVGQLMHAACPDIQGTEVERKKYFDELLTLKHTCLRDGKPYIRALVGGSANTSPEGAGKGFDVSGAALALRCI